MLWNRVLAKHSSLSENIISFRKKAVSTIKMNTIERPLAGAALVSTSFIAYFATRTKIQFGDLQVYFQAGC